MKKILNIFETVIIALGIVLMVFVLLQKTICKNTGVFGFYAYVIVTESMEPKIKVGDVILVKKMNPDKIKIGDTISYMGTVKSFKDKIVAHKVEEITEEDGKKIFYTKGINNDAMDPAVYEEQVYGKMLYKFFFVSLLSKLIRSKIGFFIAIFVPLVVIFAIEFVNLIKNVKKTKKEYASDRTVVLKLPTRSQDMEETQVIQLPKLKS